MFDNFITTKLSLIDLAGSEKVRKSGVTGESLEETKKINYSLSCLGNVINALTTRQHTDHIPFRDSKLTRILQDSLSGKFLTSIIVTCAMGSQFYHQTVSSLKFAQRVKRVKILPQNQILIKNNYQNKNSLNNAHLADSIQFYQQKISQLVNQLEKTKGELNSYKAKTIENQGISQNNNEKQQNFIYCLNNNKLTQIRETTQQYNYTGRSMAQQTQGDITGRLPIPSQRANVAQKFSKYTQKQIVPLFLGSRGVSSNNLNTNNKNNENNQLPLNSEQQENFFLQISNNLQNSTGEFISLSVSNTFFNINSKYNSNIKCNHNKTESNLLTSGYKYIENQGNYQDFIGNNKEFQSNQNNYDNNNHNNDNIDFSQISDHQTSQNFTLLESKAPHRKIVNLDDKQSDISFTFSIYKDQDITSGRRPSREISTRRTLR